MKDENGIAAIPFSKPNEDHVLYTKEKSKLTNEEWESPYWTGNQKRNDYNGRPNNRQTTYSSKK